jgi:hypothetical protein
MSLFDMSRLADCKPGSQREPNRRIGAVIGEQAHVTRRENKSAAALDFCARFQPRE